MVEYIVIFFANFISLAFGFYLGARSQKEKIREDLIDLTQRLGRLPKKLSKREYGPVKTWTPEKFEQERIKKFERENY